MKKETKSDIIWFFICTFAFALMYIVTNLLY